MPNEEEDLPLAEEEDTGIVEPHVYEGGNLDEDHTLADAPPSEVDEPTRKHRHRHHHHHRNKEANQIDDHYRHDNPYERHQAYQD